VFESFLLRVLGAPEGEEANSKERGAVGKRAKRREKSPQEEKRKANNQLLECFSGGRKVNVTTLERLCRREKE